MGERRGCEGVARSKREVGEGEGERKQLRWKCAEKADDDGGRRKLWVLRGPQAGAALRFGSLFVGWWASVALTNSLSFLSLFLSLDNVDS